MISQSKHVGYNILPNGYWLFNLDIPMSLPSPFSSASFFLMFILLFRLNVTHFQLIFGYEVAAQIWIS